MPFVLEDYNDIMSAPQNKSQERRSSANGLPSPTATHASDDCRKEDARRASPQPDNSTETQAQSLDSTIAYQPEYYDYDEEEEYDDEEYDQECIERMLEIVSANDAALAQLNQRFDYLNNRLNKLESAMAAPKNASPKSADKSSPRSANTSRGG